MSMNRIGGMPGYTPARLPVNLSEKASILKGPKASKPQAEVPSSFSVSSSFSASVRPASDRPMAVSTTSPSSRAVYPVAAREWDDVQLVVEETPSTRLQNGLVERLTQNSNVADWDEAMSSRVKEIQNIATQLGYVELAPGAIVKAMQEQRSLLINKVV